MVNLNGEEYLTADEACALLGVKPATLYAYVSRGLLLSFRQGIRRRRLYRRRDVDRLLQLRPSSPAPSPASSTIRRDRLASDSSVAPALPRAEDWIPFVN